MKRLKVAVIGGGQFSSSFIHLFQAHPFVEEVGLVELNDERRASIAAKFSIHQTFANLAELDEAPANAARP
jgi:predicted dehydrogenase